MFECVVNCRWIRLRLPRRRSSLPDARRRPRCGARIRRRVRFRCGRTPPIRTGSPIDPSRCRRRIPAPHWKSSRRSSTRATARKRRNRLHHPLPAGPTRGSGTRASAWERSARIGHPLWLPSQPNPPVTAIRPMPNRIRNLKVTTSQRNEIQD